MPELPLTLNNNDCAQHTSEPIYFDPYHLRGGDLGHDDQPIVDQIWTEALCGRKPCFSPHFISALYLIFFTFSHLLIFSPMSVAESRQVFERLPAKVNGSYQAKVVSVHDGDTLRVQVLVWPSQSLEAVLRLRGVDTPELQSKCASEKRIALAAKQFVSQHTIGKIVSLNSISRGKYYGRVLGSLRLSDGRDLASLLIQQQLGKPYYGGRRKKSLCADG